MLASTYCVMETKASRRHLKLGQVWRLPQYTAGLSDNELSGYIYFVLSEKQSQGMWKMKVIHTEPKDLHIGWRIRTYEDNWTKSTEILRFFEQCDENQFKTAVVLFG